MTKKHSLIVTFILIVLTFLFSVYLFGAEENTEDKPLVEQGNKITKEQEEKYENVEIEGYLTKEGDNFVMMGWELHGNQDELNAAVNHLVKVKGKGVKFVLEVEVLTVSDQLTQIPEEVISLDGTLVNADGKYYLGDYQLIGDIELAPYIEKGIYLQGRKTDLEKVIETIEVNETKVISGTLEYMVGEPPDIHYTFEGTDFDIHHHSEIFSQEGKHVELLVYAKSHNTYIDNKHVTLIKILE